MIEGVVMLTFGAAALAVGALLLARPSVRDRWMESMIAGKMSSFDSTTRRAPRWFTRLMFNNTDRAEVEQRERSTNRLFYRYIIPYGLVAGGA